MCAVDLAQYKFYLYQINFINNVGETQAPPRKPNLTGLGRENVFAKLEETSFVRPMLTFRTKELSSTCFVADTTGNRLADIIMFEDDGVHICFNNDNNTFQDPKMVTQSFAYTTRGWRVEKHIRFVADIRNIGRADIIGFGDPGVFVSLNNGKGSFAPSKLAVAGFGYNAGAWRIDKHLRLLGDVYGTGTLDIIGFGEYNVLIGKNNGDGSFELGQAVINDMCYSTGWRTEKHLRFVGDLTGNRRVDLIGFGDKGVSVALNNGDGTFQSPKLVLESFGYYAGGWLIEKHPRFLSDLTGNGRLDIIGFGDRGVSIALNNGNGTFQAPKLVLNDFGYKTHGWRVEKNPRFIADLTGNKVGDIVGFGNKGVYVAINNGDGTFQPVKKVIDDFAYDAGDWRVEKHLRFPVDLTGDGCADIVGFAESTVFVSFNDGKGNFGPVQKQISYNRGERS